MLGRVNDLDIRLLRVFVQIVESGGFKQACIELNISPSQISGYMNDLEVRLGYMLCERGRSGFRVTPRGEVIYREAVELLSRLDEFRTLAVDLTDNLSGEFRIGTQDNLVSSPGNCLPEAIYRFAQLDHAVRLSIEVVSAVDLEQRVLEGTLDLGFGFFYHEIAGLQYQQFFEERHQLYCGVRHPLFVREDTDITLADIEAASVLNRGIYEHDQIASGPVVPKFRSNDRAFAVNPEGMLHFVLSGFALGYLPEHYAASFEQQGAIRPIWPDRIYQFGDCAMLKRDVSPSSPVLDAFLKILARCREQPEA